MTSVGEPAHPRFWEASIFREAPPYLLERDPQALAHRVRAWAEMQLDRVSSVEFAATFARNCPVSGRAPQAYNQRIVELDSGERLLVGIRFKGGDVGWPFVDLVASSAPFPLVREEGMARVRESFQAFAPKALRVVGKETTCSAPGERLDQAFHAADLEAVRASGPHEAKDDLRLEFLGRADVDRCLALVESAYKQFAVADPDLAAQVPAADREQLTEYATVGFLTLIRHEGREVGVLSLAPGQEWLFDGLCVVEEVLLREHTGRGLAARAQRLLASELLDRGRSDLLRGTVAADNVASRKSAEHAGRRARAAWRWLAF